MAGCPGCRYWVPSLSLHLSCHSATPCCLQLGALGLGTVLFQFAVGFFACLIIATTPRVAACSDNKHLVSE